MSQHQKIRVVDHYTGQEHSFEGTPETLLHDIFARYGKVIRHKHREMADTPTLAECLKYLNEVSGLEAVVESQAPTGPLG